MRGRPALAWLGFLTMAAITTWWAVSVGRGVLASVLLLDTHAGILFVGTLLRGALRRASRRINSLNARSLELASAAASSDAEQDIRRQRVAELAEVATPLLSKIAPVVLRRAPRAHRLPARRGDAARQRARAVAPPSRDRGRDRGRSTPRRGGDAARRPRRRSSEPGRDAPPHRSDHRIVGDGRPRAPDRSPRADGSRDGGVHRDRVRGRRRAASTSMPRASPWG